MRCEYCDNPVPNGVTRCPSCGAAISDEQQSISLLADRQRLIDAEHQSTYGGLSRGTVSINGTIRKMRVAYVLLGFFFGAIGLHNFYAGYKYRAVAQLLVSLLSFGLLSIFAWTWAIVEIIIVNEDASGQPFA